MDARPVASAAQTACRSQTSAAATVGAVGGAQGGLGHTARLQVQIMSTCFRNVSVVFIWTGQEEQWWGGSVGGGGGGGYHEMMGFYFQTDLGSALQHFSSHSLSLCMLTENGEE